MSLGERADVVSLGDTSFEDFVAGSSSRLFGLARLLTGGNRAEAEDLLQGAFERAYWHWRRISRRGNPERYVRQMLVNASVDRWRRLLRRPEEPMRFAGHDPSVLGSGRGSRRPGPLLRGLRALPARQRAALVLRYFEDLSEAQTAQAGVKFAACPASYLGPVTVFWVGYLNGGLSCVPFTVTVPGQRPIQLAISADGGTCSYQRPGA